MIDVANTWLGWKLVKPEKAAGGNEARTYNRLMQKYRRQQSVMEIVWRDRPELIMGESGVEVGQDEVQHWVSEVSKDGEASVYQIRDQINFLASSLSRGKKELGWIVEPPAPISLIPRETSPFTTDSFEKLSSLRDWQAAIESNLVVGADVVKVLKGEPVDEKEEYVSWGLILYFAMTRDGILNAEYLNALSRFAETLCVGSGMAWLTLFDKDSEKDERRHCPTRWRWMLGPAVLFLLLNHIKRFGHPRNKSMNEAVKYTSKSWTSFCRKFSKSRLNLTTAISMLETDLAFKLPPYLIGIVRGKGKNKALPEYRWRQLLQGGRFENIQSDSQGVGAAERGERKRSRAIVGKSTDLADLERSEEVLQNLKNGVYKRRNEKRLSYKELYELLNRVEIQASAEAPIIHALSLWVINMHKRKLTQSTLYTYLGEIGRPLFLALGGSSVTKDNVRGLEAAYQQVIDQAVSAKSKNYKRIVLLQFHEFLVAHHDFPRVSFDRKDGVKAVSNVDANLISEKEYDLIRATILKFEDSGYTQIIYWIFILGYRAGLRIGEALSIQIRDIQLSELSARNTELILLVRENEYVDIKSYDSRRQLPLHLLLTASEYEEFRVFCLMRKEVTKHSRVMLFSTGNDIVAPLLDAVVHDLVHEAMREVTGDSSLHFHHLRHSFANNIILAYHDILPPWSGPSHLDKLMETLGLRNTRKGLYFIAQLFGHASPSETLKSYIHCLELVQHHCRRRSASCAEGKGVVYESAGNQLEPFLSLLEIRPATLRKWKSRFGDDYAKWFGKALSDVSITEFHGNCVEPYREATVKIDVFRSLDQLNLHELETMLFAEGKSGEEIDTIFRLEAGSFSSLKFSYENLLRSPSPRKSMDRRHARPYVYSSEKKQKFFSKQEGDVFLLPPQKMEHKRIAERIYRSVQQSTKNKLTKKTSRERLLFFHKYHRAREGYIYMPSMESGVEFITWLCSLGRGFELRIKVTTSARSAISPQNQLAQWRKCLVDCSAHKSIEHVSNAASSKIPFGTAILKLSVVDRRQPNFRPGQVGGHPDNSWPVRYALFMGCVLMAAMARGPDKKASS